MASNDSESYNVLDAVTRQIEGQGLKSDTSHLLPQGRFVSVDRGVKLNGPMDLSLTEVRSLII